MPKTDYAFFQGKTKWFRYERPNQYDKWSHDLYLNDRALTEFRELQMSKDGVDGIKNDVKKDEDGFYVTISRPVARTYRGKNTPFSPPTVIDKDGVPFKGNVGNGSDVTTKVEIYRYRIPTGKDKWGSAMRWVSSRIDNLVEFKPQSDYNEAEQKVIKNLQFQPEQLF